MEPLLQYFVFGMTLAVSIGPVNMELINRGLSKGFLSSWLVGIGGMTADFVIVCIVYMGLGTFFTSDIVQVVFGCIGSVMLAVMGFQNTRKLVNRKGENYDLHVQMKVNERTSFKSGFLLAIANPLNIVFWTGIYSSIVALKVTSYVTPLTVLTSIFVGITLSNMVFAFASSLGKSFVKASSLRSISFVSGIVLVGYGLWIGYTTLSSKCGHM